MDEIINKVNNLNQALEYAIKIIESYEMDIRDSEWVGIDLVEKGFCQGSIYKNAINKICKLEKGVNSVK